MQDPNVSARSLKLRLLFLFLSATAVTVAGGYLYFRHYLANVEREKDELITSIALSKIDQIVEWREDRLDRVRSLLDSPILSIYLKRFAEAPGDAANTSLVKARMGGFLRNNNYRALFITDKTGKTLLSAGKTIDQICPEARELLKKVSSSAGPAIGELHTDRHGAPGIHVAALAARSGSGRQIFLVASVNPEDYLYPLIQRWPISSRTGETLLVREEAGRVLFLNELRHQRDTALKFSLPAETPDLPAVSAARGVTGVMRGRDYRGKKVLAYTAPIPGSGWGIVAKIDEDEAFAETRLPAVLLLLLVLLVLASSGAGAFLLFHVQTKALSGALKESEQIFREFLEHSPIYVFFKDENIRSLRLSRNFEKLLGRPLGALLGKNMNELFPSDFAKKMVADDLKILREGKEVTLEEKFNGRKYITTKFPIHVPGKPTYLAGFTIDVTEQRKTQELLTRVTDQVPGVVYQYRLYPDGRSCFPYSSSGMFDIYEVTPDEVREDATPVFGRIHPDDLKSTSEAIFESARNLSLFHWEFRVVLPKQGLRWRMCDARPERLPDGGTLWDGIITDITDRKNLEARLQENERRLAALFSNLPGIAYRCANDRDWTMEFLSEGCLPLTGYRTEELVGSAAVSFNQLIVPEDRARVWETIQAALADSAPYQVTYDIRCKDGARKTVWEQGSGIKGPDGGVAALEGFISDITARKLAERKTESLNKELLNKNQEMENFLYITTHDLRSPLVNIQGFSRNLKSYLEEFSAVCGRVSGLPEAEHAKIRELFTQKAPEALGFILDSSRKMDALITALLKVSRAGRVEMKPERVETGEMVHKLLDAMRFQLQEAGAKVRTGTLPACQADPGALSQVFANLLDNAVKYRDKGRQPAIEITGERLGDRTVYTVADNGPGIPAGDLDRIWNVFYAHSRPAAGRGEGIGLPMVKRLLDKNFGAITVSSKEGAGTTFRIELPAPAED